MTLLRSIRSRPESYNTAVSVGCDHGRRQGAPSLAAPVADFLTQRLVLWLHDAVSEQRACLGIVAVKIDDRTAGARRPVPNSSTWDAPTISNQGSRANAANAASSALLARPTRQEDLSTPDRGRPSAPIP